MHLYTAGRQRLLAPGNVAAKFPQEVTGQRLKLEDLAELPKLIRSQDLGYDISTDNDPRENGAHAQWRPVPLGFGHPTVEPVEAKVYLAMADEPALVGSVAKMIGALLIVVVGLYVIARLNNAERFSEADAVVAVSLIVPRNLAGAA